MQGQALLDLGTDLSDIHACMQSAKDMAFLETFSGRALGWVILTVHRYQYQQVWYSGLVGVGVDVQAHACGEVDSLFWFFSRYEVGILARSTDPVLPYPFFTRRLTIRSKF